MKIAKIALVSFAIISLLGIGIALAQPETIVPIPENITDYASFIRAIKNVLNFVFSILLIASIVVMLYAGYAYVTSAGDEGKTQIATKMIVYAAIGLIIALLSKALQAIIPDLIS